MRNENVKKYYQVEDFEPNALPISLVYLQLLKQCHPLNSNKKKDNRQQKKKRDDAYERGIYTHAYSYYIYYIIINIVLFSSNLKDVQFAHLMKNISELKTRNLALKESKIKYYWIMRYEKKLKLNQRKRPQNKQVCIYDN